MCNLWFVLFLIFFFLQILIFCELLVSFQPFGHLMWLLKGSFGKQSQKSLFKERSLPETIPKLGVWGSELGFCGAEPQKEFFLRFWGEKTPPKFLFPAGSFEVKADLGGRVSKKL